MRGQRLRQSVGVMKPVRTNTEGGGVTISYLKVEERPAAITPISASDRIRSDQNVSDITHKIRMWWFEGLTPDYRLETGGRIFEISGIINQDERNKHMEMLCTEQAGAVT